MSSRSDHPPHSSRLLLALPFFLVATLALALEISASLLEYIESRFGEPARQRMELWESLVLEQQGAEELAQVKTVNRFFNQVHFVSDLKHWNQEDYWATPVELLATNGGDCEDYSIAKYLTLRALGVADDKLRITYVKSLELNQAHMVLAYYPTPDADPLILDNLDGEIRPASQRQDLEPVYNFNGDGLWLTRLKGRGKRIGDASKLERWVNLNDRLIDTLR